MRDRTGAAVALTADGVTVLVDATDGRLPAIAALGSRAARAGRRAGRRAPDGPDPGRRVEQHRRAAAGRRAARAARRLAGPARVCRLARPGGRWSPRFTTTSVRLDGADGRRLRAAPAPARLEVAAVDAEAGLELLLTLELLPSGLLRSRAVGHQHRRRRLRPRRAGAGLPGPGRGRRAARLRRAAQPGADPAAPAVRASAPTCGRTARAAPAPTAPTCCTPARPASASPTARSSPCTPRGAATTPTTRSGSSPASSVLGGGELLLPGEIRLAPGETLPEPVALRVVRRSGWTRWPAASTGTCAAARSRSPRTAR